MNQVMTVADKCKNGKTGSAGTRVKYTKPKLTNPKPFRLRTDVCEIIQPTKAVYYSLLCNSYFSDGRKFTFL